MNFNEQDMALSGLEKIQRYNESPEKTGMAANLGCEPVQVSEGKAVYRYHFQERHLNLIGTLHGGCIAALIDSVIGVAVMTVLAPGERHTLTDLQVRYLRAITRETGPITITATIEHSGRRMIAGEAVIHDQKGRRLASGSAAGIRL